MNNYTNMYLVKVPVAFFVRSDEEYNKDAAYGVIDAMSEAAFENGDSVVWGKIEIEEVF